MGYGQGILHDFQSLTSLKWTLCRLNTHTENPSVFWRFLAFTHVIRKWFTSANDAHGFHFHKQLSYMETISIVCHFHMWISLDKRVRHFSVFSKYMMNQGMAFDYQAVKEDEWFGSWLRGPQKSNLLVNSFLQPPKPCKKGHFQRVYRMVCRCPQLFQDPWWVKIWSLTP